MSGSDRTRKHSDRLTRTVDDHHDLDVSPPAAPTALMTVGAADHPEERAADVAAERALSRLDRLHTTGSDDHDHARRHAAPVTGAEVGLDGGSLESGTDGRIRALQGRGRPLPDPLRRSMEAAFESPLDRVRVHTGAESADLNSRMSASAFTIGQDIFLGGDQLTSGAPHDRHVLAHEIAHTLQGSATVQRVVGPTAVIRRFKIERADDGGNFVGEKDACHCHIDVGKPHFKVGKDKGSRINFGRDMKLDRLQQAYETLLALHRGKKGFADCKEYLETKGCTEPESTAVVQKLKAMLISWGGLSETTIGYYTADAQRTEIDAYTVDRLDDVILEHESEIRLSGQYWSQFQKDGDFKTARGKGASDKKVQAGAEEHYQEGADAARAGR